MATSSIVFVKIQPFRVVLDYLVPGLRPSFSIQQMAQCFGNWLCRHFQAVELGGMQSVMSDSES